ncbi:MAG TPA: EthD family reductase [Steroidobacteraceae bacterium]
MHKVIVLYNTPADPQHFRSYYEKQHLPLVARLPGLRSSRYSFAVQGPGPGAPAPFFCIWEGEFDDEAATIAAMSSAIGGQVVADVPKYADGGFTLLQFTLAAGPVV